MLIWVRRYLLFTILFFSVECYAQMHFWNPSDSLSKPRIIGSSSVIGSLYAGSLIGLQTVWYTDPWEKFHLFDDSKEWLQMDKVGHAYTCYHISGLITSNMRWSGLNQKTSLWIGVATAWSYQGILEVFDGFSTDWGFSISDISANTLGAGLFLGQDLLWKEQRFLPKFSFSPTPYAAFRPNVLGSNFAEQLLKDYNGQTYWLSFSPGKFGLEKFPKWLCFSVGYSVDQKLVGHEETYLDFHSKREYLFSMDIDFSALPVKNPFLKTVLRQLNYLKIPFPALNFSRDGMQFRPFYF